MSHRAWCGRRQSRSERIVKRLQKTPEGYLLPLRVGEELALSGRLELRVLRGGVELWGARLAVSRSFQPVVVPPWCASPRLLATRGEAKCDEGEAEEVKQFLATRNWPVVLCLRSHGSCEQLRESLALPATRPRLRAHRSWLSLARHFLDQVVRSPSEAKAAVLVVMGAKGVGKSTCCRFLVNRLLSELHEVYFLETDLGQPELGPPGVVTLHRLVRPLLQTPHAEQHQHQRICAFLAGSTTPAFHPALYTACVGAAFEAFQAETEAAGRKPVLVVNSHGWVTGLGLELVQEICGLVGAQLVLRLLPAAGAPGAAAAARARRLGVRRTALARCGPLARALKQRRPEFGPGLVLVDLDSAVPARGVAPLAAQLRWLRLAQHFDPARDPCEPAQALAMQDFFGRVPRWRLRLAGLRFGLVAGHLLRSEVEAALTGVAVALCTSEEPTSTRCDLVLVEPHEAPIKFVAYAFVHCFDFKAGEVVVYSPCTAQQLESVDLVLRGEVAWEPNSTRNLKLGDGRPSPLQPYSAPWLLEGMGVGSRVVTTKGNLKRRRLRKI
ncbi:unnamed protein product [Effrenium voratum]|nr:unnamed protein product [Effrenium voratum]